MPILTLIKTVITNLKSAILLAPIAILLVVFAEGFQHAIEWHLGMYQSKDAFMAGQSRPVRLSFGIIKAISVIAACYFVPKKLSETYGPPAKYGSFNKDMIRKLWDPRGGISGLIAMLMLAAPLIYLHFRLSGLAVGHPIAATLLVIDSLLIGLLALVMGTSVWAADVVEYQDTQKLKPL